MKSNAVEMTTEDFDADSKQNKRNKAIIEVIKLLESDVLKISEAANPMIHVPSLLKNRTCLRANLFKKNQIGGTREIAVLQLIDRLCVNFLETISRSVCNELPGEMLTKDTSKIKTVDRHYTETMVDQKLVRTRNSSSDAATWCQQFVMPVFFTVLYPILPDEMLRPIGAILNLVTRKELELPHELLSVFDKNPSTKSYDKNANELKRQFVTAGGERDLIDHPRSRFLMNRSNMMQGILHFPSCH